MKTHYDTEFFPYTTGSVCYSIIPETFLYYRNWCFPNEIKNEIRGLIKPESIRTSITLMLYRIKYNGQKVETPTMIFDYPFELLRKSFR